MSTQAFGPTTVTTTPVTVGPTPYANPQHALVYDSGVLGAIPSLGIAGTTTITGYTGTANVVGAVCYSATGTVLGTIQSGNLGWNQSADFVWTADALPGTVRVQIFYATAMSSGGSFGSTSASALLHGSITYNATTICAYGTQPNPDTSVSQVITDALIDLVVAAALAGTGQVELIPYVETMLGAIEGITFISIDCSTFPTGSTALDLRNPSTITPANLQAWFQQAAWHYFCQCVPAPPGSADPVSPPKPTILPPDGLAATQPAFICDNTDICGFLTTMKTEIEQLLGQIALLRTDVTLIQRQAVPFSFVTKAVHSGLTDAGTFDVQGLVGLAVQLTTIPGRLGEEAGEPIGLFDAGWVTTRTTEGWRPSTPLRHNPMWVTAYGDDIQVGYTLEPGVVANIVELAREP